MLERGRKISVAFLMFVKLLTRYGFTACLLYKLFIEFGVEGRMWLTIKDLYTAVKTQVLYLGSLSRQFDISLGQGRILHCLGSLIFHWVRGEYLPPLCARFILMPC